MRSPDHTPAQRAGLAAASPAALSLLLALCLGSTSCAHNSPRDDLSQGRWADGPDGKHHLLSGESTWYGERHHGRTTACGEPFDMHGFTAAHRSLPFHTIVRVVDIDTLKSVVVRINDRGPYGRGRVIDLSKAAAADLDIIRRGKAQVELEVLRWGDGTRCR